MSNTTAPGMRRRSMYMASDVADRLDREITDLHFNTRKPKHMVLAAVVTVALEHCDEIEARLTGRGETAK